MSDTFKIIRCPKCNSEIAVDRHTIYPIDCDCGYEITKKEGVNANNIIIRI